MAIEPGHLSAVILAGGKGTRLGSLTMDWPKPMITVEDRPFLGWIILFLYHQGLRHIVVSAGFKAEVIARYLDTISLEGLRLECVIENSPLGTAGAFRHAAATVSLKPAAWLVLNGDSMVLTPLAPLWESLDDSAVSGALLGVHIPDRSRFGALQRNARGELIEFNEKQSGREGLVNAGIYLIRPSLMSSWPPAVPLSFECDLFPRWLRRGERLKVHACSAPFLDIGTPESLAGAGAFIAEHRREIVRA